MSSFDKVVKLACKPKAAPPKSKYLDPIIAATWSEDGAVYDVCKALVPRLREPNAIVVFKALIVLHTMIRNGATDNVLSHLSSSEVLRLRNVSAGNNWEGYNAPQNLQHYALYLDSRIRAFRELKHDAIRVQSETNRDMRVNNSIEEDMSYPTAPKAASTKSKGPQRSKTIMGRKLRVMTVEKGLLRETKTVQKMIDALVECRFYLDNLEDELTITALRMLVKDLLILFQACNEGVINVLEHYFEMSKYDAQEALTIYRHFCEQTERVMEYLGVAKKLQNLLNVSIPTLKHAPVSLASSLEEYLNDPNFEQNRIEYRTNKEAVDKNEKSRNGTSSSLASQPRKGTVLPTPTPSASSAATVASTPSGSSNRGDVSKAMSDLFNSIEEEQPTANPPIVHSLFSPAHVYFQQPAHNPFVQRQMTGAFPIQTSSFPAQMQMQPTGFATSQTFQTPQAFQSPQPPQPVQQPPHPRPFSTFLQMQPTGFQPGPSVGLLQPQATGMNPFRQSVLLPQATGMAAFNVGGTITSMPPTQLNTNMPSSQPFALQQPMVTASAPGGQINITDVPARPASTPLTTFNTTQSPTSPPIAQPVKTHQTGSRNPFGVPVTPAPPVPKPPTLLELSMGLGKPTVDANQPMTQHSRSNNSLNTPDISASIPESIISNVATSFAFSKPVQNPPSSSNNNLNGVGLNSQMTGTPITGPTGSTSEGSIFSPFTPLSSQQTGAPITSSSPSFSLPSTSDPLRPQMTGFGGLKPFKPTSSFGAALFESLPPIPQSTATTPDVTGAPGPTHTSSPSLPTNLTLSGLPLSAGSSNPLQENGTSGDLTSQTTGSPAFLRLNGGSTVGVGLRPQATGAFGAANPFRATMFATPSTMALSNPLMPSSTSTPQPGLSGGLGGAPMFGAGIGGNTVPSFSPYDQNVSKPLQQPPAGQSLI
ncbi:hypothetical protein ID866_5562 [Astraeus odoratus]|nr:hypothetical protein ID866_5562 [Astraeus odoratus]